MNDDDITAYNNGLEADDRAICDLLRQEIEKGLPEATSKVWHGAPAWFLNDNPIVGYSKLKGRVRLMFWSGADFGENDLEPGSGKFKDAHIDYPSIDQVNIVDIARYIEKSKSIQWDYRNIVKRKGKLERL
jgi:hypothetical protein